jgi:hypothetical protein
VVVTRQIMCVERNIEARLCNHCCSGKGGVIGRKMCILILYTNLCETFLILRRNERNMTINVISLHIKCPEVILCQI